MVKYIKSSERSERLTNIQKNREQKIASENETARNQCLESIKTFQNTYGSRIKKLYDTWCQLYKVNDGLAKIYTNCGYCYLEIESYWERPSGWICTPIQYDRGCRFYISKNGALGWHCSIPHGGYVVCDFEKNENLFEASYSNSVRQAVSKLTAFVDSLEEEIYVFSVDYNID